MHSSNNSKNLQKKRIEYNKTLNERKIYQHHKTTAFTY